MFLQKTCKLKQLNEQLKQLTEQLNLFVTIFEYTVNEILFTY